MPTSRNERKAQVAHSSFVQGTRADLVETKIKSRQKQPKYENANPRYPTSVTRDKRKQVD